MTIGSIGVDLENRDTNKIKLPSTTIDIFSAFFATVAIVLFFSVVHYYFGGAKKLDTNITSFFGISVYFAHFAISLATGVFSLFAEPLLV